MSPIGSLARITGWDPRYREPYDHFAFIPDPLPPNPPFLNSDTQLAIATASAAIARLDQAAIDLPNPGLLARPAIRREAVSTSAIEGIYATLDEILQADLVNEDQRSGAVAEVFNYIEAAELAFDWITDRPITLGLLEEIQKIIVRGTRGDTKEAGHLRTTQVFIGSSGRVDQSRFVPPPPGDSLRAGVQDWLHWINTKDNFPLVVKLALGHYQFETLHPFNDGNGRIGRLICVLQLMRRNELHVPVLNISPWLEKHRQEYQDHLLNISITGELNGWIQFFCQAIITQSHGALDKIQALHNWRDETSQRLNNKNIRGLANNIAKDIIGYPVMNVSMMARRHGSSSQGTSKAIKKLVDIGILEERTGGTYARMFSAPEVLRIIESE